ncbi:unnamed protein product [Clonostachys rosea f. rosea IK726]|uniref:Heterokaryon incompatibility domain-containing protein n=2 Tax=Bionectria ochroleuca TaxID=29856 RepID=A0A0B7KHH5_BIOOC|nr:unnamed protein product [Clonostachys rosea f. rosea IK726]
MRLINVKTYQLEEYYSDPPRYAILSHTWGGVEVTFQDWQMKAEEMENSERYDKIIRACKQAQVDGLEYLWCDTNCIDKTSSTELAEAINSMFSWYKNSAVCYAYLADVPPIDLNGHGPLGWTLQELLAPTALCFFAQDWAMIGSRDELASKISAVTGIEEIYLGSDLSTASIGKRMSWLSNRQTTRVEDLAYCMFGIFDINMPLLYGEGEKAFIRLQEEIIRVSNDQTIFCWTWDDQYVPLDWASILSPSPRTFKNAGDYSHNSWRNESAPYIMTNAGLSISLPVLNLIKERVGPIEGFENLLAVLDVRSNSPSHQVALLFHKTSGNDRFRRSRILPAPVPIFWNPGLLKRSMYIAGSRDRWPLKHIVHKYPEYGVLLTMDCCEALPQSFTVSSPKLESGILSLGLSGEAGYYGRFLTIETSEELNRKDHTGDRMACKIFFGVRVRDGSTDWCTKIVGAKVAHDSSSSGRKSGNPKRTIYDKKTWRFQFPPDRDPMSDWMRIQRFNLVASVHLSASVQVAENSMLAVARIRVAQLNTSPPDTSLEKTNEHDWMKGKGDGIHGQNRPVKAEEGNNSRFRTILRSLSYKNAQWWE